MGFVLKQGRPVAIGQCSKLDKALLALEDGKRRGGLVFCGSCIAGYGRRSSRRQCGVGALCSQPEFIARERRSFG